MINKLVAYDIQEVKNKYSLAKVQRWFQGRLIDEAQWEVSKARYKTNLFTPSFIMRILLFIATILGISTILGPLFLIFDIDNEAAVRVMLVLVGLASVIFIELKMIKSNHHFKSGVTEAGYYIGLAFIYFGVLSIDEYDDKVYVLIAFLFFLAASIRYLDLVSLAAAVCSFVLLIFLILHAMLSMIPFLMIGIFLGLFFGSRMLQRKADMLLWENHFVLFDTLALLLIYLAGNYFVVREMSVDMMGLDLKEGADIPFAFLFYILTFLIPVLYLAIGVIKKYTLLIRVGVLTILLSVVTIKYYYNIGYPEVTVTLAGGVLILISLSLMKYLKQSRNGFTREKILSRTWEDSNLAALVASQTLGGQAASADQKLIKKSVIVNMLVISFICFLYRTTPFLSHDTEAYLKTKIRINSKAPPLIMHIVGGCAVCPTLNCKLIFWSLF